MRRLWCWLVGHDTTSDAIPIVFWVHARLTGTPLTHVCRRCGAELGP